MSHKRFSVRLAAGLLGLRPGRGLVVPVSETLWRARMSQGGIGRCGACLPRRRVLLGLGRRSVERAEGSRRSGTAARRARSLGSVANRHRLDL